MTPQEIDRIQNAIRHIQTATDVDPWAVEIAVKAMEKQVPKKPGAKKFVGEQIFGHPVCFIPCGNCGGNCGCEIHFLYSYCPWCGQAIDQRGDE